jgi:hypothetical protein
MSSERKLRFKVRRADGSEIELEGDYDYVKERFEEFIKEMPPPQVVSPTSIPTQPGTQRATSQIQPTAELEGILEQTPDGRMHLVIPADSITAREAVALMIFVHHPNLISYQELSNQLSSSWKATKEHVVRARASELRKEGRLIVESGRYGLSGSGIQWVRNQILPKIRSGTSTG